MKGYIAALTPTLRSRDAVHAYVAAAFKAAKVDDSVVIDEVEAGTHGYGFCGRHILCDHTGIGQGPRGERGPLPLRSQPSKRRHLADISGF